jgi:lysylphosphatidylglycerol synthetase-like protein (DUF2156 family)
MVGVVLALFAISTLFNSPCVPSVLTCTIQGYFIVFINYLPMISLLSLAISRTMSYYNKDFQLNCLQAISSLVAIWSLAALLTFIQLYSFNAKFYYSSVIYNCMIDASQTYFSLYFAVLNVFILPNILIISISIFITYKKPEKPAKSSDEAKR